MPYRGDHLNWLERIASKLGELHHDSIQLLKAIQGEFENIRKGLETLKEDLQELRNEIGKLRADVLIGNIISAVIMFVLIVIMVQGC